MNPEKMPGELSDIKTPDQQEGDEQKELQIQKARMAIDEAIAGIKERL
jgi:hypothetical protein